MKFPSSEAEIILLAQKAVTGFKTHPDKLPSPPLLPDVVQQLLDQYFPVRDEYITLQAQADAAKVHSLELLSAIADALKPLLRYAEHAIPDELDLIGWGGRAAPTVLQAPGQPRLLEVSGQGDDWAVFDWKKPSSGGKPAFYSIYRRELPNDAWVLADSSADVEVRLTNLPKGKPLEFKVVAANKVGIGPESNVVTVVL